MEGYLGVEDITDDTRFSATTAEDWALCFTSNYGGIDGGHHKDWVLDQVARILNGTPVIIKQAN